MKIQEIEQTTVDTNSEAYQDGLVQGRALRVVYDEKEKQKDDKEKKDNDSK